jgi:2-polyprenyl-6-methoxyphenol hydroxylase-like FAD-dependent oxidoreductase
MPTASHRHDVAIVGARAAGAATALLLARLGHDVVLLDRDTFPSDTISTHQIARTGVVALQRWGLLDSVLDSGAPAIRQVTFATPEEAVTRQIKAKSGVDLLVAPRRYILDTIMAESAEAAGADLRTGVTITGVRRHPAGRATGVYGYDEGGRPVEVNARFVIGADGLGSGVAAAVSAGMLVDRGASGSAQYAYYGDVAWSGIELIASERALVGVFPTHHGEACVWICRPTEDARSARRLAGSRADAFAAQLEQAAPALAHRLRRGRQTSPVTGMLRMPNFVRQAYGPGWALVGDAGYHRDAVTGHGISDAYRDAELLTATLDQVLRDEADEGGALAEFQSRRNAELRGIFDLTCSLAAYPPVAEFVELQKQLSAAIDVEAAAVAARPVPGLPAYACG